MPIPFISYLLGAVGIDGKRIVKTLVNSSQTAGYKSMVWDTVDDRGHSVSAGLYIYSITAGNYRANKKMILLK